MLRIYGYAASINVRKVLWTCAELALPFEREDWAGPFRPTSDPAFLSLNPVGLVPVIDDDGAHHLGIQHHHTIPGDKPRT